MQESIQYHCECVCMHIVFVCAFVFSILLPTSCLLSCFSDTQTSTIPQTVYIRLPFSFTASHQSLFLSGHHANGCQLTPNYTQHAMLTHPLPPLPTVWPLPHLVPVQHNANHWKATSPQDWPAVNFLNVLEAAEHSKNSVTQKELSHETHKLYTAKGTLVLGEGGIVVCWYQCVFGEE